MKQKITLVILMFLVTLFAFGQSTELKNNELFRKSKVEKQLRGLKQADSHVYQTHLFQKNRNFSQNSSTKSTQVIKQSLDSIVSQDWDETTSQWVAYNKHEYTYDTTGNITQSLYYYKDVTTSQLVARNKSIYTYDTYWNMTQYIRFLWDETTSQWITNQKEEYTYDISGNMTQTLEYNWDETTSQWITNQKEEYTYDISGNMTQTLEYHWDEATNQWDVSYKREYTYDTYGNMTQLIESSWYEEISQWSLSYKSVYTFNANGNLTQYLWSIWYEETNWIDCSKADFTYDSYDNIVQLCWYERVYDTSQWVADSKDEPTYNNSYSFSDLILPYFYTTAFSIPIFNHMMTESVHYLWDETAGDWGISGKHSYYYSEQNINSVSEINSVELNVYPNPFSKSVSFDISGYHNKIILEIFDIQGRKVISKEIRNHENVSMEGLNTGMYFYTLINDGKKLNGKLIKE